MVTVTPLHLSCTTLAAGMGDNPGSTTQPAQPDKLGG